jgi:hypothetical protein
MVTAITKRIKIRTEVTDIPQVKQRLQTKRVS